MNNIYIFRIDDFSEEDAIMAKKFDKSDKVIFMPKDTDSEWMGKDDCGHLEYETLDHMLVDWLDELKKNEGSYKFDEEIAFIESMFKPNKCTVTIKIEIE